MKKALNFLLEIWENLTKEDKTEYCVLCHETTEYSRGTHISQRRHYIEGAGQLCKICYDDMRFTLS